MPLKAADVVERFIRGSGAGGQKVNKTSSTVELVHVPTGLSVRCQQERSQARNREVAWLMLEEKVEKSRQTYLQQRRQASEKIRRQKRGRNKTSKEKTLTHKRFTSQKKAFRKKNSAVD